MQETTNYRFKKIDLDDSPPDITAINPNWDEADRILKEHEEGIEILNLSTESINEQLGEKVKYTDLTPIVTTGTSSAYIVTIPTNMTEVTIVPHINNLASATLNGIAILDREGKPIEKDVLKINIPTKLVRVGSNFFIVNSGKVSSGDILDRYGRVRVSNPFKITASGRVVFIITYGASKEAELFIYGDSGGSTYIAIKKNGCRVLQSNISLGITSSTYTSPSFFSEVNNYFYMAWVYNGQFKILCINSNAPYNFNIIELPDFYGNNNLAPYNLIIDKDKMYVISVYSGVLKVGRFLLNPDGTITNELQNLTIQLTNLYSVKDFSAYENFLYLDFEKGSGITSNRMIINKETLQVDTIVEYPKGITDSKNSLKRTMLSRDGIYYWVLPDVSGLLVEKRLLADSSLVKSLELRFENLINNEIFNGDFITSDYKSINRRDSFIKEDEDDGSVYVTANFTRSDMGGCIVKIPNDLNGFKIYAITNNRVDGYADMNNSRGGYVCIKSYQAYTTDMNYTNITPDIVSFK